MTLELAVTLTIKLVALNLCISSLEFIKLQSIFKKNGIWKWSIIQQNFKSLHPIIFRFYQLIYQDHFFIPILILRFVISISLLFTSSELSLFFLFVSSILISQRCLGNFNGGSDYMTLLTLGTLSIGILFSKNSRVMEAMLMYLALQCVLSYFFAGLVKLKNVEWRSGKAIGNLVNSTNFSPPAFIVNFFRIKEISFIACWIVLIWQLTFPFIFIMPHFKLFILLAICFHFFNFIFLGLNRFFWTWLSTYPALIYTIIHS